MIKYLNEPKYGLKEKGECSETMKSLWLAQRARD